MELSKLYGRGPVRISEIADKQAIPPRFLENILNELKSSGLVESRRGAQGGYLMAKDPSDITIGRIIRLIDGPLDPVKCIGESGALCCKLKGGCALIALWDRAKAVLEEIYDNTTFADLVEEDRRLNQSLELDYSI
jgi:Rrf2 family protein